MLVNTVETRVEMKNPTISSYGKTKKANLKQNAGKIQQWDVSHPYDYSHTRRSIQACIQVRSAALKKRGGGGEGVFRVGLLRRGARGTVLYNRILWGN